MKDQDRRSVRSRSRALDSIIINGKSYRSHAASSAAIRALFKAIISPPDHQAAFAAKHDACSRVSPPRFGGWVCGGRFGALNDGRMFNGLTSEVAL